MDCTVSLSHGDGIYNYRSSKRKENCSDSHIGNPSLSGKLNSFLCFIVQNKGGCKIFYIPPQHAPLSNEYEGKVHIVLQLSMHMYGSRSEKT